MKFIFLICAIVGVIQGLKSDKKIESKEDNSIWVFFGD